MDKEKQQQLLSDYIKRLPAPSAGMKLIAEAGATYIRHRLGLPPKDARYVLARFTKPFIQAKWFGMGGREIGVASFEDIEEKWSTALYDIPEKVDPAAVLLLRFEPIRDVPAFDAGRCFTWSIGTDEVAVCQVLSEQVMEVFKGTDPFTSRRIVGFARLDAPAPLPDAVDEQDMHVVYKTRQPIAAREPNQLLAYQQLHFPVLDNVSGIEKGELLMVGAPTKPQGMLKCGSKECAEAFAKERSQSYGHSAFDGSWYVGTHAQLRDIGCTHSIIDPYLDLPPVGAETFVWYGTGQELPMGPISVVVEERDCAMNLLQARVTCRAWLERHGLSAMRVTARVYADPQRLLTDSYGWFVGRVEQWQGIPTEEIEVSTFNLRGVTKLGLSTVAQDETQDVTTELVHQVLQEPMVTASELLDDLRLLAPLASSWPADSASITETIAAEVAANSDPVSEFRVVTDQVMTNTSKLPTISKEERALLDTADRVMEVLEGEGIGGPEYRAYREAEANFLATRKEF